MTTTAAASAAAPKLGAKFLSEITERILDRLVEAVLTGEHCGTSDVGPRRVAALSLGGLGLLSRHDLWSEAMRRISKLEASHPRAQERFLDVWTRVPQGIYRTRVNDDDIFFAALRVLLPPYAGGGVQLYRGQLAGEPVGPSWTRSYHIAKKFALYGWDNVDPNRLDRAKIAARDGAVVLRARVHDEIICAPCLLGHAEGEYIVDPRSVEYIVEPPK
jgi:hypothetical protein